MIKHPVLFGILMAAAPAFAAAQTVMPQQNTGAVAAANDRVAAQADMRQADIAATNDALRAQDFAAYDAALRRRHHVIQRDRRAYQRQRIAYADAMAAWRRQVAACRHGHRDACAARTPDAAAYY